MEGLAGPALIVGAFLLVYLAVMAVTVYTRRRHAGAGRPYRTPYDFAARARTGGEQRRPRGGGPQRRRAA
jgi:hypothetical protein